MKSKKDAVKLLGICGVVLIVAVIFMIMKSGQGEQNSGTGAEDITNVETSNLDPIAGFSQEQSSKIREELQERIIYKQPSNYAILEVWLDSVDVQEGILLGTLFFKKDMELCGLDAVSDIEALEMDAQSFLAVTVKMVFSNEEGTYTYEDSVLHLMVPVSVEGEKVTLGDFHVEPEPAAAKESQAYYEELGFSAATYNVITADVTHDGIEDSIYTVIYNKPELLSGDPNEVLNSAGVGFVQVFEGAVEGDGSQADKEDILAQITGAESEAEGKLIWQQEFAHARPGNTQVSIVKKDGLDYLLVSNLNEQQGGFDYSYEVLALDSKGHEYIFEKKAMGFETPEHSGIPTEEQKAGIQEFRDCITKWFADAVLVVATDVNANRHYVSTVEETFLPNQYYDSVWDRY